METEVKKVALAEVKDRLSEYLHDAADEEIVITRHGKPAGVLIGFENEDDWLDYRLEHDPRFLERIAQARADLRAGKTTPWFELEPGTSDGASEFSVSDKPRTRSRPRRRSSRKG